MGVSEDDNRLPRLENHWLTRVLTRTWGFISLRFWPPHEYCTSSCLLPEFWLQCRRIRARARRNFPPRGSKASTYSRTGLPRSGWVIVWKIRSRSRTGISLSLVRSTLNRGPCFLRRNLKSTSLYIICSRSRDNIALCSLRFNFVTWSNQGWPWPCQHYFLPWRIRWRAGRNFSFSFKEFPLRLGNQKAVLCIFGIIGFVLSWPGTEISFLWPVLLSSGNSGHWAPVPRDISLGIRSVWSRSNSVTSLYVHFCSFVLQAELDRGASSFVIKCAFLMILTRTWKSSQVPFLAFIRSHSWSTKFGILRLSLSWTCILIWPIRCRPSISDRLLQMWIPIARCWYLKRRLPLLDVIQV